MSKPTIVNVSAVRTTMCIVNRNIHYDCPTCKGTGKDPDWSPQEIQKNEVCMKCDGAGMLVRKATTEELLDQVIDYLERQTP